MIPTSHSNCTESLDFRVGNKNTAQEKLMIPAMKLSTKSILFWALINADVKLKKAQNARVFLG